MDNEDSLFFHNYSKNSIQITKKQSKRIFDSNEEYLTKMFVNRMSVQPQMLSLISALFSDIEKENENIKKYFFILVFLLHNWALQLFLLLLLSYLLVLILLWDEFNWRKIVSLCRQLNLCSPLLTKKLLFMFKKGDNFH
jgi:hypothetical protein